MACISEPIEILNPPTFKNIFNCPVCFDRYKGRIIQCLSGHTICQLCSHKLEECPQCRSNYHGTRNFALEEVMSHLKFQEEKPKIPIPTPAPKIRYKCQMFGCSAFFAKDEFFYHAQRCHANRISQPPAGRRIVTVDLVAHFASYRHIISTEWGIFFLMIKISKREDESTVYAWIQALDDSQNALDFFTRLEITVGDNLVRYCNLAHGSDKFPHEIEESTLRMAFRTWSYHTAMNIRVQIKKNIKARRFLTTMRTTILDLRYADSD